MKITPMFAALALACAAGSAFAHSADPRIDHRQVRQHDRIAHGVTSGALTARETSRLRAEQRGIAAEEHFYKRDGRLTAWERTDLRHDLSRASRDIYRQKHDARTR